MSLFHIHKWSKWGDPFEQPMVDRLGRQFVEHFQRRQCEKCGRWQEKEL